MQRRARLKNHNNKNNNKLFVQLFFTDITLIVTFDIQYLVRTTYIHVVPIPIEYRLSNETSNPFISRYVRNYI